MNEDKASPAVRWLIRAVLAGAGLGDSLANVNSAVLPNGSCCFVSQDRTIWSLDKSSTTGTVAGSSLAAMGGGTWFVQSVSSSLGGGAEVLGTGFNDFALGGSWAQTTSSSSALTGAPSGWALTAAGCILTYTGPTRDFYVTLAAAVRVGNSDSPRQAFLGISRNNDLTGAPSFGTSGAIDSALGVANVDFSITTVRKVTLASGDTLRPKMAGPTAAAALSAMPRIIVVPG